VFVGNRRPGNNPLRARCGQQAEACAPLLQNEAVTIYIVQHAQ